MYIMSCQSWPPYLGRPQNMSSQSTIIKSEFIIRAERSGGSASMSIVTSVRFTILWFSVGNADDTTHGCSKIVGDLNIGAVFMSS